MKKRIMVATVLLLAVLLMCFGCKQEEKFNSSSSSDSNVTGLNGTFIGTSPTVTETNNLENGDIIQEARSYSFDGKGNFSLYRTYIEYKGRYSTPESKSETAYGTYTVNGSNVKLEFSNGETDYSGSWHVNIFTVRIMLGYPDRYYFNEEHSTELTCLKQ